MKFKNPWPPVCPQDEKFYDIELNDGTIIERVEFWGFGGGFDPCQKTNKGFHVNYPMEEIKSFELASF